MLSVVIPTLDEAASLGALLADLRAVPAELEVIVADGGSGDDTRALAAREGARVVRGERGRGTQLRAGAAAARGEVLCFLHADVRLDGAARQALARLARLRPGAAYAFSLRIDAPGLGFRLVERGANLRSRLARLPYGDQGLVLTRADYARAGGYEAVPLMEDVALVRALRREMEVRILPEALTVSARRWRQEGVARRSLRNLSLLAAYLAGVPPERLARAYRPHAEGAGSGA